jgi:Tfp pilus assembly protein PilF
MFGWIRPALSVQPRVKQWVEGRMGWLVGQFGWDRLLKGAVILPNDDFFPEPFDGTRDAVRRLFERTCRHMDLDPASMELRFYQSGTMGWANPAANWTGLEWTGVYTTQNEKTIISLDASRSHDPESLVATFAHELAHAHLLGQRRISPDERDMEPLTDLTALFFGFGVFSANCAFRDQNYHITNWEGWRIDTQGYLPPPTWSYALGLWAWLRKETKPAWTRFLRATVRSPCRQTIAFLWKTGDASVVAGGPEGICFADLLASDRPSTASAGTADDTPADTRGQEPHSPESANAEADPFTKGVVNVAEGDLEAAIREFSTAIEKEPEDDELYQHRSSLYLQLGRLEEALADAETSVRLNPDDVDNRLARGKACFYTRQFAQAIADLSWFLENNVVRGVTGHPTSAVYYFRGLAHAAQGDLKDALGDYTKAIRCWPNWPQPYLARAAVFEQLGEERKALADREEAVRRDATGQTPNA